MAEEFNTQLVPITAEILKKKGVHFTKSGLKEKLTNHPFYPSLLSLSDTLNSYKIYNRAIKVSESQLEELPLPFFAFINLEEINTEDFVSVTDISKDYVTYSYNGTHSVSKKEFNSSWQSKVVLLIETDEHSGEANYSGNYKLEKKKKLRNILISFGFGILFFLGIWNFIKSVDLIIPAVAYLILSLLGLSISVLLLVFEIDKSNKFVKNICTTGVKTNCDAILSSSASKIFGISWAEIGFYYFSTLCLFLMISSIQFNDKIHILSILSLLTALYIPFSLSYQYFVIKQWCKLCLFVQLTLLLQFLWVLFYGRFTYNIGVSELIVLGICALTPLIIWNFLKPFLKKSSEFDKFKSRYKRLISRQDIFELTLSEQPMLLDGWQDLGTIIKGNPNAKNTIVKVCSPACHFCNLAHEKFNKLLEINDNIKIVTLYNINSDPSDERRLPVSHFLALAEVGEKKLLSEAMNYWYLTEDRDYQTLSTKFPIADDILEKQKTRIDQMKSWCDKSEIYYTPTIYFNGRKLPASYEIEDLQNIITHNESEEN